MPSPRGNWYTIDLSIRQDEDDLADGEVIVIGGIVPLAGVVKEVWLGLSIKPTTGTVAVTKQATTPVSLLSAATVDLSSITAFPTATLYQGVKQTLSTSGAALRVAAGNILTATWTLTDITLQTVDQAFTCTVLVEADVW
jgi:hypothetical protein